MVKKIKEKETKEKKKKPKARGVAEKPKAKKVAIKAVPIKAKAVSKKIKEPGTRVQGPVEAKTSLKKELPPKISEPQLPPKIEKPKVAIKPQAVVKEEPKVEAPAAPVIPVPQKEVPVIEKVASIKVETIEESKTRTLELDLPITLKDLAQKIGVKPNEIILKLMSKNVFATINQGLGEDLVKDILKGYEIEYKKPPKLEDQVVKEHRELEEKQNVLHLVPRPPVVTFMGHVDHGKTSLLDFIRKTRVADKEKGGITQHIGAYEVKFKNGSVTFLDTPGHEAFTAMRARGANATDIVVLVVAADDGVMPQTKEALDHARAAGVQIVVALNKCDLPGANPDKVKGQLSQLGLTSEDWGGKTIVVPVSAKTGEGVEHLLEMLLLESELLELKANPHLRARGVVIEGKLSSGQGPVATILVKNGTLHVGDMVLTGMYFGRIKAMMDHTG
ncbi:MAG: translation initiation factor IF-2, partial [Candidatus Omnitrophica bacterium]|nr:translation initiation factor IF-2 [Candidatus Omnitrophota bacterium]